MTRSIISSVTRRSFLRGAGVASVAGMGLPFLSSLVARAADPAAARAKRLIIFCSPNEPIDRAHWAPAGNGASFPLTSLPAEMASLEPFRDKLLMIGDLEMTSRLDDPHPGGHIGIGHLLIGRKTTPIGPTEGEQWGSGISVDQYIGQKLGMDPLTLGVRVSGSNGNSRISYVGDSQPVSPVTDPVVAFDNLFADALLPAEELAALKSQRLSVLDRVSGDLERIKGRLPAEGRSKLEIHTDMIRDLELALESDQVFDCDPTAPTGGMDYGSNASFPTAVRRQVDVLVQALGCGITDVASIQLGNSGASNLTPIWPGEGIDINIDYHNIVHDYNNDPGNGAIRDRRVQVEAFFYRMFAYLLEQLEAVPEGDGTTMLDNSLVLWMKPIAKRHQFTEFLFMLAGSANGQLETGRFVSFPGRPHNDLLVNLCNLMGLDDTSFGDPAYCTGALDLG
ncbi:MAG: DUF1552 domain-containing protein [Myxococcales bacterium]|nr:DUF1552 domain-containing protein [Myxococcales bacterium]